MEREHLAYISVMLKVMATSPQHAKDKAALMLRNAGLVNARIEVQGSHLEAKAPPKWEVGMLVEYVRNEEWAWSTGTRGRITRLDETCEGRAGDEYQVFWVSPFRKDGTLNTGYSWWTTPKDVCYISEEENGTAAS